MGTSAAFDSLIHMPSCILMRVLRICEKKFFSGTLKNYFFVAKLSSDQPNDCCKEDQLNPSPGSFFRPGATCS